MICSSAGPQKHTPLLRNWFMGNVTIDALTDSKCAENLPWTSLPYLTSVASVLREAGHWNFESPAPKFDAQDWTYRLVFDVSNLDSNEPIILVADGLATISQVWLNGTLLLVSRSMFISHRIDVGSFLLAKDNELLIHFGPLDDQLAVSRKRPRWRTPMVAHQQLRWFRTTLLGRTPGWSPPAAVVGPWRDIWLERGFADAQVRDFSAETSLDGAAGMVKCELTLLVTQDVCVESVHLQLERQGRVHVQPLECGGNPQNFSGELRIEQVDKWWPHTHGEPALYKTTVVIRLKQTAKPMTIDTGQVGFRDLTLDTMDDGFTLNVNGVKIFCRGAVWTPLDPISLRSSPEACRIAIVQARTAGMNMLRVAGTMVYEEDHFYRLCEEEGMLVWQEFMFANMDYPAHDKDFMASVELEVCQQLKRLKSCACIAVFCGNSEVAQQAAMWGAPRDFWHGEMFEKTLAELCARHAPGIPYWPSSTHGGSFPHQANAGTASYYGVGAYLRPLEDARRAEVKFATECLAFANIPAASAIERMPGGHAIRVHHAQWKARSPRDLGAGWDFDDVRDHYLRVIFNTDPVALRSADHDLYLTLGRMTTGEVMAATFSEWRRPASSCQGAIVLFLRDLWAGAGWGLVDDAGVPKACYYYLKRVLQPVSVILSDEGVSGLFVHLLNERVDDRHVELELSAWRQGDVRVASGKTSFVVPARGSKSLSSLDVLEHFIDLTHTYKFGPMACDAVAATLSDPDGKLIARAFHFPGGLAAQAETDVGLSARATRLSDQTAELVVTSKRFAQGIYFDVPGFLADDDYFHLPPECEMRVILRANGAQVLRGWVHAANSQKSVRIEMARDDVGDEGQLGAEK